MSLFPWALIFIGLALLGLGAVALVGLRLWHSTKALVSSAGHAHDRLLEAWSGTRLSDPD